MAELLPSLMARGLLVGVERFVGDSGIGLHGGQRAIGALIVRLAAGQENPGERSVHIRGDDCDSSGKVIGAWENRISICPYLSITESEKVVIVEDEPLIRLLAVGAMSDARFEVIQAGHAEEALGHLQSQPATIHLLFTDTICLVI